MTTLQDISEVFHDVGLHARYRDGCHDDWECVLNEVSYVPAIYAWDFVNYNTTYFKSFSDSCIDISVVIYHDRKPCAVWPLVYDGSQDEPLRTVNKACGGLVVPPLFIDNFPKKSQRTVIKNAIDVLNKLLKLSNGRHWRTYELSMEKPLGQWHQLCLEQCGVLDHVNYEMRVDLSLSVKEIRASIRKSFRPLISSGQRVWKTDVMDRPCDAIWDKFRSLHKRVAGRVTRPIETWNQQLKSIDSGNAFLVYVLNSENTMVGAGFFDMSAQEVNYSVGSYDKLYADQPLGHIIQYQAILTAKEKGRLQYYIGDRFYHESLPEITDKRVQISLFQQGFCTSIYPRIAILFE